MIGRVSGPAWSRGMLLARANRTGQSAVVFAVILVPQRLTHFNATCQFRQLFGRSRGGIRRPEVLGIGRGGKVFIVPELLDRFKNVPHLSYSDSYQTCMTCLEERTDRSLLTVPVLASY